MVIRRFLSSDAEAVLAIERANQPTPWPPGRLEAFSTLVAEIDGRVVGFSCYAVNHWPNRDEALLLANLSVDEQFRRRGIGRSLLEARLRIGAAARIYRAFTVTRAGNEPLKALYRRCPFPRSSVRGSERNRKARGDGAVQDDAQPIGRMPRARTR